MRGGVWSRVLQGKVPIVLVGLERQPGWAAELGGESWWRESRLLPLGEEMASVLRGYVETGRKYVSENPSEV